MLHISSVLFHGLHSCKWGKKFLSVRFFLYGMGKVCLEQWAADRVLGSFLLNQLLLKAWFSFAIKAWLQSVCQLINHHFSWKTNKTDWASMCHAIISVLNYTFRLIAFIIKPVLNWQDSCKSLYLQYTVLLHGLRINHRVWSVVQMIFIFIHIQKVTVFADLVDAVRELAHNG